MKQIAARGVTMVVRSAAIVVLASMSVVAPVSAADEPVSLDVVVTDAKMRPLQDLKVSDFELTDAGEIRAVDAVRPQSGSPRVFGILLDEFHVHAGEATSRAHDALLRFVDAQLRQGDLVAIVKPLDPLHAITFTQDRTVIRQVIAAFEGHAGDYSPRSEFERNFMSRDPRTADPARAQVVSAALQALARRLGDQPASRRALIFVSEGFRPEQPRAITSAANRNHVAIHPVDPLPAPGDDDALLRAMADETGGSASVNDADLAPALAQVTSDLDHHVILTFTPQGPEDGGFHRVQVRVKRTGAVARTRAGYWALDAAAIALTAKASVPKTVFRPSHSSPYIRPWVGMSRAPAQGLTRVTVTWEAGAAPPRNQRVVAVTLKATNSEGQVLVEKLLGPGDASRATFDAPPGLIAIEMAIQTSSGTSLDTDYRSVSVPNLQVSRPTFATPQILRTRSARQFAEVSRDANAAPTSSRSFSRTERLLVRVSAYGAAGMQPVVSARLLNRRGTTMRELEPVAEPLAPGIDQFDLPLASLAPDEYRLELGAVSPTGPRNEVKEILIFRVID